MAVNSYKIKLSFVTTAGENYDLIVNDADPTLAESGGKAKCDAAGAAIIAAQPFLSELASYTGATLTSTAVTTIA